MKPAGYLISKQASKYASMIGNNVSVNGAATNNISQSSPLIFARPAASVVASTVLVHTSPDLVETLTQSNDVAPFMNK